MSNASVVRKIEQLAPDSAVGDCLRDLFLYELRNVDKANLQYKDYFKTVLSNFARRQDSELSEQVSE